MSINDQEKRLFREAMAALQQSDATQKHGVDPTSGPHTPEPHHWPIPAMDYAASVGAEDTLFYSASELPPTLLRRLKLGRIPIEGRIDLHGMTVAEAHQALANCIAQSQHNNHRLLLIIHGKGDAKRSTLKTALNHALRDHPGILAFCSAQAKHGGKGAMYLLLKKPVFDTTH